MNRTFWAWAQPPGRSAGVHVHKASLWRIPITQSRAVLGGCGQRDRRVNHIMFLPNPAAIGPGLEERASVSHAAIDHGIEALPSSSWSEL